jgi:predicted nucleic acid-binding protein
MVGIYKMRLTMAKPNIWIIDTTIFLNILDIPGSNSDRATVLSEFKERIKAEDLFFLPFIVLVETGNPIAKLSGNLKYEKAKDFVDQIKSALNGVSPFTALKFPDKEELLQWIDDFPAKSSQGIGFGDYSIIRDWQEQCVLFPGWSVRIWSLDEGLQGYES